MGLIEQNEEARRVILGGRDDPEHTKMADGRTVAEHQAETQAAHLDEARASAEMQTQRMREQSMRGDPLYAPAAPAPEPRRVGRAPIEKPAGEGV